MVKKGVKSVYVVIEWPLDLNAYEKLDATINARGNMLSTPTLTEKAIHTAKQC